MKDVTPLELAQLALSLAPGSAPTTEHFKDALDTLVKASIYLDASRLTDLGSLALQEIAEEPLKKESGLLREPRIAGRIQSLDTLKRRVPKAFATEDERSKFLTLYSQNIADHRSDISGLDLDRFDDADTLGERLAFTRACEAAGIKNCDKGKRISLNLFGYCRSSEEIQKSGFVYQPYEVSILSWACNEGASGFSNAKGDAKKASARTRKTPTQKKSGKKYAAPTRARKNTAPPAGKTK